jgi:hypothetical protein
LNPVQTPGGIPSLLNASVKRLRRNAGIALVAALYVVITCTYALVFPAWETNDEMDHVANIQYMLKHRELVPLRLADWHETHQPPLYYALAAVWQRALGVKPFLPAEPEKLGLPKTGPNPQLTYTHRYNKKERNAAKAVRKLRLFSVVTGLGTVLLTYAAGLLVVRRREIAVAAAAFVALLPKFNTICGAVSNDALVVMLCSVCLVCVLWIWSHRAEIDAAQRARYFALGLAAGAALITKLNSVPVCGLLLGAAVLCAGGRFRERIELGALAAAGFFAASGWWLYGNIRRGTGLLGQGGAFEWLDEKIPGLIVVVPWTNAERFLNFVPSQLIQTMWYNGAWNQFVLPFGFNLLLLLLAAISCFGALKAFVDGSSVLRKWHPPLAILIGACVMSLTAVIIIAKSTTQAEGRVAYTGLSAFAILILLGWIEAVGGSARRERIALWTWPVLLLLLNVYVLATFVFPYAA